MRIACFALAAALSLAAAPASAAVSYVMSGVVTSGSENGYNLPGYSPPFGSEPYAIELSTGKTFGQIFDRPFTLTITVDTSKGDTSTFLYPNGTFINYLYGADGDSGARAMFTLNDISYAWGSGDTTSRTVLDKGNAIGEGLYANVDGFLGRPLMDGVFTTLRADLTLSLGVPPGTFKSPDFGEPLSLSQIGLGRATLNLDLQETTGTQDRFLLGLKRSANLNLRIDSIAVNPAGVTPPGAVPEPSTWAMMILGFGAAGVAIRRRARGETAAAV